MGKEIGKYVEHPQMSKLRPRSPPELRIFPWISLSLSLLINALSPSSIVYQYSPAGAVNVSRWNRIAAVSASGGGNVSTRKEQLLAAVALTEMGFAKLWAGTRALVSRLSSRRSRTTRLPPPALLRHPRCLPGRPGPSSTRRRPISWASRGGAAQPADVDWTACRG